MYLKCMSISRGLNENGPNGVIHLNALLFIGGIAWKRLGSKAFVGGCVVMGTCAWRFQKSTLCPVMFSLPV